MSSPIVVLHFDVNKTVLIADAAGGVSCERMLNGIVSEQAWGLVRDEAASVAEGWECISSQLSDSPPFSHPNAISFAEAVEVLPREERHELTSCFTLPGSKGERFRKVYEQLLGALQYDGDVSSVPEELRHLFSSRRYHLLPALFHAVNELVTRFLEGSLKFSIVFRTFGNDIANVAAEWNLFCSKQHPLHTPVTALDGTEANGLDLRIRCPQDTLRIIRKGAGLEGISAAYISDESVVSLLENGREFCHFINQRCSEGVTCMACQDDFEFWHANGELGCFGKVLLVDRSPNATQHHIFFDDNIERDHPHIVDARDHSTGESIPFEEAQGVYLSRCDPMRAIVEPTYFIDCIDACVERLRAIKSGK